MRRVSEEALTWRRLHRVSLPSPGPAYLCWILSPAAYRTVLASGWLQTNRQFWHLGLWSQSCSAKSCLSPPCFVTTDPAEPTRPPHTSPEAGVTVSFGPRGPRSSLHPSAHFPHKGNRDWQGSREVMEVIRVRDLGLQSIDLSFRYVPSRGRHSWYTGSSPSVPCLLEAVSKQLITDCVAFTSHSTPL